MISFSRGFFQSRNWTYGSSLAGGFFTTSIFCFMHSLILCSFCPIMLCKASLIHQMVKRPRFNPWVRKIPWKREWQPTPVFLPEESHGQRSLVGCSPWGCKESDTTEQLTVTPTLNSMFTYNWYLYKYSNVWYIINRISERSEGKMYSLLELQYTDTLAAAATAAKSLQSCPTLCNPRDGSPPGSPIPGILQARTLEWVAISFSNAWKGKVQVKSLSRVRLFATPWTAAYQAPPSMGFSRQEYWSGVPLPSLILWLSMEF